MIYENFCPKLRSNREDEEDYLLNRAFNRNVSKILKHHGFLLDRKWKNSKHHKGHKVISLLMKTEWSDETNQPEKKICKCSKCTFLTRILLLDNEIHFILGLLYKLSQNQFDLRIHVYFSHCKDILLWHMKNCIITVQNALVKRPLFA